jgi:hypothetical protein
MGPQFIPVESNSELDRLLNEQFMPPFRKGYVRVGPNKVLLPLYYLDYAERIEGMEVRDSDVWVVSHPKAGRSEGSLELAEESVMHASRKILKWA